MVRTTRSRPSSWRANVYRKLPHGCFGVVAVGGRRGGVRLALASGFPANRELRAQHFAAVRQAHFQLLRYRRFGSASVALGREAPVQHIHGEGAEAW